MKDVIIIGAGPAGMTAAIYAARYKLDTAILTKDIGGMAAESHKVCNFPSYVEISGMELMQKVQKQVEELDVPILFDEVTSVEKKENFIVNTKETIYESKKVIVASGTVRRKLDVPGEKEFLGKGVSYCATCDGAFFQDKIVAVVGGSDAALTAALLLTEYATKVYIIYRRDHFFRGEPVWIEQVIKHDKIEPVFNEEVKEINGDVFVESVLLKSGKKLEVGGVFIEIGSVPKLDILKMDVESERGYIVTNENKETNISGLYAVGDITKNPLKQIVTAAADGAIAAYDCYKSLKRG